MRTGNIKKIEKMKNEGYNVIDTHYTTDGKFADRHHTGSLKHWNNGTVVRIGWDAYKLHVFVLIGGGC